MVGKNNKKINAGNKLKNLKNKESFLVFIMGFIPMSCITMFSYFMYLLGIIEKIVVYNLLSLTIILSSVGLIIALILEFGYEHNKENKNNA